MRTKKGIVHILFPLFFLTIFVLAAAIIYSVLKGKVEAPKLPFQKESKVAVKEDYTNPFDKKAQYVNPFSQYKNPFENIK